MKNSIKAIAATLVAAAAIAAPAQSHAVDFGIRAGLDVTSPGDIKSGITKTDLFKAGCGFHAGVVADIDLVSNFFIEPGLYLVYHTTGTDFDIADDDGMLLDTKADVSLRQFGLQIPVRFGYKFGLGVCDLKVFTGPSFGIGLSGKLTHAKEIGEDSNPYEDLLNRFNMGWNLGAGVVVSRFYIGADYTFGLNNRIQDADDISWRQGTFSVSIGYYL